MDLELETWIRDYFRIDYPNESPEKITLVDLTACWETAHHLGFMSAYPIKTKRKAGFRPREGRSKYPIDELRPGESFIVPIPSKKKLTSIRCSVLTCIRERKKRFAPERIFKTHYNPEKKVLIVNRLR